MTLTATTLTGFAGWYVSEKRNNQMNTELAQLRRQARISAVGKSVSRQMEEIAYEQKNISDEQREEAQQQTRLANELRARSEIERQHAIIAQQAAMASERKALDAYDQAEQQRIMAEHQRGQAEMAKRVADTLNYITLGRSLGSLAIKHYRAGNQELAKMLSYASYMFTERYQGDLYYPSVYQALSLASQSRSEWAKHEGAIMNMDMFANNNKLITVSDYGEIMLHEKKGNTLKTTPIFIDKNYDFRDVWVREDRNIYALSRTGHMFIITPNKDIKIIELQGMVHPFRISKLGNKTLVVAENTLALFNPDTYQIEDTRKLDYKVTCCARDGGQPVLFDNKGRMHYVKSFHEINTKKVPVLGIVTDFDTSSSMKYTVYGMSDGTVFLVNQKGEIRRLVGHRSRISKVKVSGKRVFSASYDGTLNLWISDSEKMEPIELYNDNNWIMHFTFDSSKDHLWVGDQKGNLVETTISIPLMADKIERSLKRNMTREEWNYYIGRNVKYEPLMAPIRKEGQR